MLFGETHRVNPRALVPEDLWPVVQLWHMCRSEFGYGHLPDGGGASDQPAWTMDAFSILAAADAELRKGEPKP